MRAACFLFAALLTGGQLHASTGAAYLNLPQSAKALALGRVVTMIPGEIDALWQNPATLGNLGSLQVNLAELHYPVGLADHAAAVALPVGRGLAAGLQWGRQNASDSYRDAYGRDSSSFEVSSTSYGLSLGGRWERLAWGATGRYLREVVEGLDASGASGDIGTLGVLIPDFINASLVLRNLGYAPVLGATEARPAMPTSLVIGIAANIMASGLTLALEFRNPTALTPGTFALAGIYTFGVLDLMAAYDSDFAGTGTLDGLSAGIAASTRHLDFIYGIRFQESLGSVHCVSVGWH